MTHLKLLLALSSSALFSVITPNAHAMLPACQSASSDSDGDGYGWENNRSCIVGVTSSASSSTADSRFPVCTSASSDSDGDGYGWENNNTCLVASSATASVFSGDSASGSPVSFFVDPRPTCVSASSDPDGDGYGWENNATCLVRPDTGTVIDDAPTDDAPAEVEPADSEPADADITSDDDSIVDESGDIDESNENDESGEENIADDSSDSFIPGSGEVIRTTSLATVATKTVTTTADEGDLFATERVGNFLLNQNAWRSSRAAPGYEWSQSIHTNTNGAPVSWTYDWGPGVPGTHGRASEDFYVRSYPELIFGIKDETRTSAPKSEIGLPVRVDEMPNTQIDFAYNSAEFGAPRTVDASVTTRFPNGSIISGERNVAVESFLYEPTDGVCDDNLEVTRSNGSNHAYEVMVWLDSGAERLPASSRDFVTTITLRGSTYNVYTKSNDERYIAFVAQDPVSNGTIYWNDYMDWARQNAHQVEALFGARSNSVPIQDSWCVANIIVGTEIFWGAGNFDLFDWSITQRQ